MSLGNRPPRCPTHRARFQKGCVACQRRVRWYNQHRRDKIRQGAWEPMVEVGPVRAHVRGLLNAGMRLIDVAEASGLEEKYLCNIMYVESRRHLTPGVANALLGVTYRPVERPYIDATGTRRRLRALCAIGWTLILLADRLDADVSTVQKWFVHPSIRRETDAKVRRLYKELATEPGPSNSARKRAAAKGWPPPAAWDDDIDNPDARPQLDAEPDPDYVDEVKVQRVLSGARMDLTDAEALAALTARLDRGDTITTACQRLRIGRARADRLLATLAPTEDGVAA